MLLDGVAEFHNRIDYNGVVFSREYLNWGRTFLQFGGSENSGR